MNWVNIFFFPYKKNFSKEALSSLGKVNPYGSHPEISPVTPVQMHTSGPPVFSGNRVLAMLPYQCTKLKHGRELKDKEEKDREEEESGERKMEGSRGGRREKQRGVRGERDKGWKIRGE